jgi:hypothetical protein
LRQFKLISPQPYADNIKTSPSHIIILAIQDYARVAVLTALIVAVHGNWSQNFKVSRAILGSNWGKMWYNVIRYHFPVAPLWNVAPIDWGISRPFDDVKVREISQLFPTLVHFLLANDVYCAGDDVATPKGGDYLHRERANV